MSVPSRRPVRRSLLSKRQTTSLSKRVSDNLRDLKAEIDAARSCMSDSFGLEYFPIASKMTSSKNLINSLNDAVSETLSGLSYAYPRLEHHPSHGVLLSPDVRTCNVNKLSHPYSYIHRLRLTPLCSIIIVG